MAGDMLAYRLIAVLDQFVQREPGLIPMVVFITPAGADRASVKVESPMPLDELAQVLRIWLDSRGVNENE